MLARIQALLERIYDLPTAVAVEDFLISDPDHARRLQLHLQQGDTAPGVRAPHQVQEVADALHRYPEGIQVVPTQLAEGVTVLQPVQDAPVNEQRQVQPIGRLAQQ